MDPIREAFNRAKTDISDLKQQLDQALEEINQLKQLIAAQIPTHAALQQTNQHSIPTHYLNEPSKQPYKAVKSSNINVSTGNDGVPTNQPTNQQTNKHIGNEGVSPQIDRLERVTEVLNSLDELKKEVRFKFKKLTAQEMAIFSAVYELETKGFLVDYGLLSSKLQLSEISIRDYVRKLVKKGIPIQKTKENNKKVLLSVPLDFRKIASLETIESLRNL